MLIGYYIDFTITWNRILFEKVIKFQIYQIINQNDRKNTI